MNDSPNQPAPVAATLRIDEAQLVEPLPAPGLSFFGDYALIGEIASGAMGVVYRARQVSLNRTVALKMILAGRLAQADEIRRFRVEAEAAAALDHPNIVPIYEIGEHEKHHFFSMKLVEGESLAGFNAACKSRDAAWLRRCGELMVKIARAVQHAHERGVLHRDLKPGNILLDESGEPHVTDFGLAKLTEQDTQGTMSGAIMGTPAYMAPEQAAGNTRGITTASDVYALGAVLYELVAGRRPFVGQSVMDVLEQVRTATPPSPRDFNKVITKDLETIILKCLEKEPAHRYTTASALADELERWLAGKPILARPISTWERAIKWTRRNPLLASAFAAASVCALAAVIGITWQWRRAETQRARTAALSTRLETQKAENFFNDGNPSAAIATLARVLRDDPANPVAAARIVNRLHHRRILAPLSESLGAGVSLAFFGGDGRLAIAGTNAGGAALSVFGSAAKAALELPHKSNRVFAAAISRDGCWIATGLEAGARLWSGVDGKIVREFAWETPVPFVAFRERAGGPPSLLLVTNDAVLMLSVTSTAPVACWRTDGDAIVTAVLATEGNRLALATQSGAIWLRGLDAADRWIVATNAHKGVIRSLAFSPDGRLLVSAGSDRVARMRRAENGELTFTLHGEETIEHAAFNADGSRVVTAGRDGVVQIWNTATGNMAAPAMVHPRPVNTARFSPDGRWVLTACDDGVARVWSAESGQVVAATGATARQALDATFDAGGRRIAVLADGAGARLWTMLGGSGAEPTPLETGPALTALFPKRVGIPAEEMARYSAAHGDTVTFADATTNGVLAATASRDRTARIWNRHTLKTVCEPLLHDAVVNCAQFGADGGTLVTSTSSRKIRLWDTRTGLPISDWITSQQAVSRVCLSADARFVVSAAGGGWSVFTEQAPPPAWLPALAESVAGLRYSADRVSEPVLARSLIEFRGEISGGMATNWLGRWAKELLHELPVD